MDDTFNLRMIIKQFSFIPGADIESFLTNGGELEENLKKEI